MTAKYLLIGAAMALALGACKTNDADVQNSDTPPSMSKSSEPVMAKDDSDAEEETVSEEETELVTVPARLEEVTPPPPPPDNDGPPSMEIDPTEMPPE